MARPVRAVPERRESGCFLLSDRPYRDRAL